MPESLPQKPPKSPFFFLGLDVITAVIIVFLLGQLDVEKVIDKEQAEIAERHAAAGDSAKKD